MSQLTHTGVRPHVCPECKATFTQRAMLNAHMKKYAVTSPGQISGNQGQIPGSTAAVGDVVPFLCASCGHGFRQRSALNSHSAVCSGAAAAAAKTAGLAGGQIIPGGGHSNVAGNSKTAAAVPTPENSALLKTATVPIV